MSEHGFWTYLSTRIGVWVCGCPAVVAYHAQEVDRCPVCGYLRPEPS